MNALYNALTDSASLPTSVMIGGVDYPIVTGYRYWASYESALLDNTIPDDLKRARLLGAFLPVQFGGGVDPRVGYPFSFDDAMQSLNGFYACGGLDEDKKPGSDTPRRKERGYDYVYDFPLIYAAFLSTYQLDLAERSDLHWWVFHSLFAGLPCDARIWDLISRRTHTSKKPTPEEKRAKADAALPERIRWYEPGSGPTHSTEDWVARIWSKHNNKG